MGGSDIFDVPIDDAATMDTVLTKSLFSGKEYSPLVIFQMFEAENFISLQ